MTLPNKIYDILKWITMIVIPALATAYVGFAGIWGWPLADEVAKSAAVVCTLLGALLGISTAQYNKTEYTGKHAREPETPPENPEGDSGETGGTDPG